MSTTAAPMTPEQRAALIARLAAGRANKDLSQQADTPSRAKFADMHEWERLASEAGLQLPIHNTPLTTGGMEKWLRRLGIPLVAYHEWNGCGPDGKDTGPRRLSDFITRNPTWTMRAWSGLVLEHRDLILTN